MQIRWSVTFLLVTGALLGLASCNNKPSDDSARTALAEQSGWQASKQGWQGLVVGESTAADVAAVFRTPVSKDDRYAYALRQNKGSENTFLMMVDFDQDGILTAKYYWEWFSTAPSPLVRMDIWEMVIDTEIPGFVLQEYTATLGPREEAVLQYFGQKLYEIAAQFEHLNQVFGATGSMKRILTLAATEYNMRADKQTLLSEHGFVFDGGIFGNNCTISLRPIDEQAGWYFLVLKGSRAKNFFSGW